MKVLLDTNIVVDVLQDREPMAEYGRRIFLAVANHELEGYLTAKEVADIHFFARKQFKGQDHVDEKAREIVAKMMALFGVIDTTGEDCRSALVIDNGDYEDAVMIASAARSRMEAIVTRNPRHFAESKIPIYKPDDFVAEFLRD